MENNQLSVVGPVSHSTKEILTDDALTFLRDLVEQFAVERNALLAARVQSQARFDAGELPDFLKETAAIRDSDWDRQNAAKLGPAMVESRHGIWTTTHATHAGVFMESAFMESAFRGQGSGRQTTRRHEKLVSKGIANFRGAPLDRQRFQSWMHRGVSEVVPEDGSRWRR